MSRTFWSSAAVAVIGILCASCIEAPKLPTPRENAMEQVRSSLTSWKEWQLAESTAEEDTATADEISAYEAALSILQAHPNSLAATPFFARLAKLNLPGKNLPLRRIYLQWLESGNQVIGAHLEIGGQTYDAEGLDPQSAEANEQYQNSWRRHCVLFLLEEGSETATDFDARYVELFVILPPSVLEKLYERTPYSVGLILDDGTRTSPIDGLPYVESHY